VKSLAGKSITKQRDLQRCCVLRTVYHEAFSSGGQRSPSTESTCVVKQRYLFSNRAEIFNS
jgi:hypothetical protein